VIPAGVIVIWSGAVIDIPDGWALCDGTHGTPDLHLRFILGTSGVLPPGTAAGSAVHDHTFTGDGHSHTVDLPVPGTLQTGANKRVALRPTNVTGTTDSGPNMPPWYALAYIMKT